MKAITGDNYFVRPFATYKTQTYQYTFLSGGNPEQMSIDIAEMPPTSSWTFESASAAVNPSGLYQKTLGASIAHLFYGTGSYWNKGATLSNQFTPSGSVFVFSLAQQSFGERVQPGSFSVKGGDSTVTLYDNGDGKIVSTAATSSVVGNIFYPLGIVVIKNSGTGLNTTANGMNITTGSVLDVSFNATHTIYEHQIFCTIDSGEFNFTSNPSHTRTTLSGETVWSQMASGSLVPYMTTIGCYNDRDELVAIAKFPRPLKRAVEGTQTVIIRFDA
jgi:hypothetical protein